MVAMTPQGCVAQSSVLSAPEGAHCKERQESDPGFWGLMARTTWKRMQSIQPAQAAPPPEPTSLLTHRGLNMQGLPELSLLCPSETPVFPQCPR